MILFPEQEPAYRADEVSAPPHSRSASGLRVSWAAYATPAGLPAYLTQTSQRTTTNHAVHSGIAFHAIFEGMEFMEMIVLPRYGVDRAGEKSYVGVD